MAKRQNVVELNGQKYDAKTGKIVTGTSDLSQAPIKTPRPGKHVDGFVRRKKADAAPVAATKQATIQRTPTNNIRPKTEKSKTLMRTVVKKPTINKIHAQAAAVKPKAPVVAPKAVEPAIVPTNHGRVFRASHIAQSNLIRKFSTDKTTSHVKTAHVPVAKAPVDAPRIQAVAAPINENTSENAFDKALSIATSHFQPKVRKVRVHERVAKKLHLKPSVLTLGSSLLVILAIGGYWAYQNVPNVALRIATTKAGVSATLPTYEPAGFSLDGPIATAPGKVSLSYKSNSDDREFKVIQSNTSWNSQTLLDNFVTSEHTQYQSLQAKGRTVYLYDNNATWVDGGVWYQITGDAKLNRDQIMRIVDGL